jgi:hypothetical protein
MKKLYTSFFVLMTVCFFSKAQTTLSAGDIAFVAIQSGETGQTLPDRFAFVLLKSIDAETQIVFTDNGVLNPALSADYCRNEGFCNWISTSNLPAGTVVSISADSAVSTGLVSGSINLSQSGDQIIAFQALGSDSIPLAAISTTGFETTCAATCGGANNNKTCLPAGLSNGVNAISFPSEQNNAYFDNDDLSGSPQEILAQINNPANWVRSDQLQTWQASFWNFNVTSVSKDFEKETIFVNPNPAKTFLQVSMPDFLRYQVLDATGRKMEVSINSKNELNIRNLPAGVYCLQLISGTREKARSIRFVKE